MNRLLRFCAADLLLAPATARAQQAEPAIGRNQLLLHSPAPARDTVKAHPLAEAFGQGQRHGRVRNYFMAKRNQDGLCWQLEQPGPGRGACVGNCSTFTKTAWAKRTGRPATW